MTRGGKREGAGRKKEGITKKVSLTLTQEEWDVIGKSGEENVSAYIKRVQRDPVPSYVWKFIELGLEVKSKKIAEIAEKLEPTDNNSIYLRAYEDIKKTVSLCEENHWSIAPDIYENLKEIKKKLEKLSNRSQ